MRSFNVLSRELNPLGTYFLEASAGTGKTFAIEHVVTRLILSGKMTIDQILVVTFTRAATQELKERIRANLENVLNTDFDYVKALLETPKREYRERLEEALASFDSAQIFTIHGFCYRMLSEFAFFANVHVSDPDGNDYKKQLKQTILDFFRTELKPESYHPLQIARVLKKCGNDIDKVCEKITRVMEKEVEPIAQALSAFPGIKQELFLEDFMQLSPCYKKMTHPDFPQQAAQLGKILATGRGDLEALLKDDEFFIEQMHEDNLKVRAKFPERLHYPGIFEKLGQEISSIRNPMHTLQRIAKDCKSKWEEILKTKEHVSHDLILRKMQECLEQPHFCKAVQNKYKAAIVDEFQDTDPIQWDIFKRLFLNRMEAFYLVGDPKQSIYSFRNADIKTYLKAAEEVGKEQLSYLDTNFRSDPSLVTALNALFADYLPVKVKPGHTDRPFADEKGHIHFFLAEGDMGRGKKWPTIDLEQRFLFPFIAQEIHNLQIPLNEICILVKDRYHATRLCAYLKQCHIPTVLKRTGSLLDSPVIVRMKELLEAVIEPDDWGKIKKVLSGPLVGYNHLELKDKYEEAKAAFRKFKEIFDAKGFPFFLACFLQKKWVQGDFPHFKQLAELLVDQQLSADGLLHYLEELEKADPDDELLQIRSVDDEKSVTLMTTHMSKGLEFGVVFALGVCYRHYSEEQQDEDLDDEKLRQLYVALTRAKHRLYIPLLFPFGNLSPLELFWKGKDPIEILNSLKNTVSLTYNNALATDTYPQPKELSQPPASKQESFSPPHFQIELLQSFSSLAQKTEAGEFKTPPVDILPIGSETGHILHLILEKLFSSKDFKIENIHHELKNTHLANWEQQVITLINETLDLPILENCTLRSLDPRKMQAEMEFVFPINDQLFKGFIDLVFEHEGKYYFLDWKSNWLENYSDLESEMKRCDYFLQASIYTAALERYVKLFDTRPFSESFGGALYLFLRGKSLYSFRPIPYSPLLSQGEDHHDINIK